MIDLRVSIALLAVCMVPLYSAHSQGYEPDIAEKRMTVADGLGVTLFAREPEVRQPIFVKVDDRGRLWTIQYLQYPNPAGLKRVKVDRWSRTIYDRVPQPPPHGPRGADKITILKDTDQDGRADRYTDFATGLNLATGVAFGHGGVFVLNVPYLLFYPDRNRDDVPDSPPQVLLTGFGMEDAQSLSNHLTWGPDGWLYGVNGSTTTCNIRGIEFQQGVWRYHPISHDFELFCEGGSNCYGITFDANGQLYYSTNGGPFVHAMQGAYYYKSFGKHGPLHNLYAYHYFPQLTCDSVPGGPPTGGNIYLADAFPSELHGAFVAGNFLGHTASYWHVIPEGSTVRAAYGGVLLDSHDTWFAPTDICMGPDGSLYICDFHDQRTAHPDPDATWDVSNGRIYKIESVNRAPVQEFDLARLTSVELLELLGHQNQWFRKRAQCELASRRDPTIVDHLRDMARQTDDKQEALEGLWALYVTVGLDDELAIELLDHPHPYVRYWAVRLAGDNRRVSDVVAHGLVELAARDDEPVVKAQLACTAKRLPASQALPLVEQLLVANPLEADSRIPWLIWWAIEAKAVAATGALVTSFTRPETWENPAARSNALRLVRRWAAEGTTAGYTACAQLLRSASPDHATSAHRHLQMGLSERSVGLHGIGQGGLFAAHAAHDDEIPVINRRRYDPIDGELRTYIAQLWQRDQTELLRLALALQAKLPGAKTVLLNAAFEQDVEPQQRVELLYLVRDFADSPPADRLRELLVADQSDRVKIATLEVAAKLHDDDMTKAILAYYGLMSAELRMKTRDVLFARPDSSLALLRSVDRGQIDADEVPISELRRLSLHGSSQINEIVRRLWGNIGPGTLEEKLAVMRKYNNDLRGGAGDFDSGIQVFAKHCGTCHRLHGAGHVIGPELTTANRSDREALLAAIVDPSAVIRRDYINYVLTTTSGQVLTGLLAEQDAATITLLDAHNKRIKVLRQEVDELVASEVSLMPERILENLTSQELRDLFAYLQK